MLFKTFWSMKDDIINHFLGSAGHQFVAVAKKFAWPWLHLLTPFRAASSGRDPTPAEESPTLDVALFEATIDDADLWLPAGGQVMSFHIFFSKPIFLPNLVEL